MCTGATMTIEEPLDPALYTGVFEREALRLVKHYDFSDDVTVGPLSQSENTILLVDDRKLASMTRNVLNED